MGYILFHSTNYALWCNDLLNKGKIKNKVTSVPRELSSDCGYCVSFSPEDLEDIKELLKDSDIEIDRIEVI